MAGDSDEDLKGFELGSYQGDAVEEGGSSSRAPPAIIEGEICDEHEAGSSKPKMVSYFMGMGFAEEYIVKAIKENREDDESAILNSLLSYAAIDGSPSLSEPSPSGTSASMVDDEDLYSDFLSEESSGEECAVEGIAADGLLSTLVKMGFTEKEAVAAIERCGPDSSILEIADSIDAARLAEQFEGEMVEKDILYYSHKEKKLWREVNNPSDGKKRRILEDISSSYRRKRVTWAERNGISNNSSNKCKVKCSPQESEDSILLPNPMVGFGLPDAPNRITSRKLPQIATGAPYFFYENVAFAPKGVWTTISRFLYGIEPEFVDSKHFCAAARKRGYIHNLPIKNRFQLHPVPPKTIHEALPLTKKWWPKWDPRRHLNCLQTCTASAKLTERIRNLVSEFDDQPPIAIQQSVLKECRKWNLVWVGLHKVAPLEPDEIEELLGFPKNHTRGGGISRTERYRSLGNSFQVETVAYLLSVLKQMFPQGMNVLSLFSGIGGAEVALHRLGIHLKNVVSVEISEINRNILQSWWEQSGQTGNLIHICDVQQLTSDRLEKLMSSFHGFDLVIGGSPCNNLAGGNRVTRDGLQGEHSSLFYDYVRILELVKAITGRITQ